MANWSRVESDLLLKITSETLANYPALDFFPLPGQGVIVGHPTIESRNKNEVVFRIPIESSEKNLSSIPGLIVFSQRPNGEDRAAWQISSAPIVSAATPGARARDPHFSALRVSRRHHFKSDAVRVCR